MFTDAKSLFQPTNEFFKSDLESNSTPMLLNFLHLTNDC